MKFEKYFAGQLRNDAYDALWSMVKDDKPEVAYAETIRRRVKGELADLCVDNYYIAYDENGCYNRLWSGWGKHKDAIGNFGHFLTLPEARGKGLGDRVLDVWASDILTRGDVPLGLFCTAEPAIIDRFYRQYGFREIDPTKHGGYLYLPLGDSPETFTEFCEKYYQPSKTLIHKRGNLEYRHELDCLLRFAMSIIGKGDDFFLGEYEFVEEYLIFCPERVGMLFAEDGHCVGWSLDGNIVVHPLYKDSKIINKIY